MSNNNENVTVKVDRAQISISAGVANYHVEESEYVGNEIELEENSDGSVTFGMLLNTEGDGDTNGHSWATTTDTEGLQALHEWLGDVLEAKTDE